VAYSHLEDIAESRITDRTIRKMYEFIDAAKTNEKFIKLVQSVLNTRMRGEWKQYRREAEVLLQWVKQTVDYRRDPVNVEMLGDVWRILDTRAGDCDDFVVLLGGALEATGTPVRIVTVSTRPDKQPSHVYLEAYLDGRWEPMDGIIQWSTVGWRPADGITATKLWKRSDVGLSGYEENPDVSGINGLGEHRHGHHYGWDNGVPPGAVERIAAHVAASVRVGRIKNTPAAINEAVRQLTEHAKETNFAGLGMHSSMPDGWVDDHYNAGGDNGPWEGGFANRMYVVPFPGIPNDVAETFAPGMPGSEIITERYIPSKLVRSVSDQRKVDDPADASLPFPYTLPITSSGDPLEIDYTAPRSRIPMRFDPTAWTGKAPSAEADDSYLMPQQTVPLEEKMTDIAGLGRYGSGRGPLAHITPSWDDYTMAGYGGGMGGFFDDLVAKAKALVEGGIASVEQAAGMVTKPTTTTTYTPPSGFNIKSLLLPGLAVIGVFVAWKSGIFGGRRGARRNPGRMNLKKLMLPAAVAVGAWVVLGKKNGTSAPASASPVNPTASPDYTATVYSNQQTSAL
jgi:hypothetical protein